MQSLGRPLPRPDAPRRDPAPSRWQYRMQRLWLTPLFRMLFRVGLPLLVVAGTTLGMLIADVPAVFAGDKLANKIPMKLVHSIAAGIFALLGVATLLGAGARWGV